MSIVQKFQNRDNFGWRVKNMIISMFNWREDILLIILTSGLRSKALDMPITQLAHKKM